MFIRRLFTFLIFSLHFGIGNVSAQKIDDLRGFYLGSSFVEAQKNAEINGWKLRQLSPALPQEWIVEGTNLGLFMCDDRILAIRKEITGGIDDFVTIVSNLNAAYGSPNTVFAKASVGMIDIYNIDTKFTAKSGDQIAVQLSSIGGKTNIHMNFASKLSCPTALKP